MRKIFVTGIGTDVGKTVVAAILVEAFHADYWKPVQTGSFFSTDSGKIQKLISNPLSRIHPESYSLKQYMSPHAAAELEGVHIEMASIKAPETSNHLVIEGAGGLMVPLNSSEFVIDLIGRLEAETVLVIQNYLGSINHSLLSIDALKHRKLNILGLVFNGPPHKLSEDIILKYSGLPLLGRVNKEEIITKEVIDKYAKEFKGNFQL